MFSDFNTDSEDESEIDQVKKKRKECEVVHSSLDYRSIKVPLMVEYNSIDSYCEKKGENLQVASISSPVVFRTPQPDSRLPRTARHPYEFFSVQELSFVKVLTNWINLKVCSFGTLDYVSNTKKWHLVSKQGDESFNVVLYVSDDKAQLVSQDLQQVYGILSIYEGKPQIVVEFFRNLRSTDLFLFAESYKLLGKYLPKSIQVLQK